MSCFAQADRVFMTDIYPAGEQPIPGITADRLVSEMKRSEVTYVPRGEVNASRFQSELKAQDIFLTLGAGDGWKVGLEVLGKN